MLTPPTLDDKTGRQLLEEALARIPSLTDDWNDFNPSDPGIALLELCAAMTEQQNFYLDQVGPRFLERYLDLAGEERREDETVGERSRRFARRCAGLNRAVIPRDYERLALETSLGIDRAEATEDGGLMRLRVFRLRAPLSPEELAALREYLEPYRLLTVRLRIEQARRRMVSVRCRIAHDPRLGRPEDCARAIRYALRHGISKQKWDVAPAADELRFRLLSIRGVARIVELSLDLADAADGEPGPWEIGEIHIELE